VISRYQNFHRFTNSLQRAQSAHSPSVPQRHSLVSTILRVSRFQIHESSDRHPQTAPSNLCQAPVGSSPPSLATCSRNKGPEALPPRSRANICKEIITSYANRLISMEVMRLHALDPVLLQPLHPRLDRFAIRAQSALTSISHISDLGSLNTSTNHQPSHHLLLPTQTLFAIHDSSSHSTESKYSCFFNTGKQMPRRSRSRDIRFPTHHRSFRSHARDPRHPPSRVRLLLRASQWSISAPNID
jgi:hypothetical protein